MTEPVPADLTADRLTALVVPWQLVLRAERKSPQTIKTYLDGVHRYLTWCSLHGAEPMGRSSLNRFVIGPAISGDAPAETPAPARTPDHSQHDGH